MSQTGFDSLLGDFLMESRERVDSVEATLLDLEEAAAAERHELLERARRELHTLKGNSGMMGFTALQTLAHHLEDEVDALDSEAPELTALLGGLDRFRRLLDGIGTAPEAMPAEESAAQALAPGTPSAASVPAPDERSPAAARAAAKPAAEASPVAGETEGQGSIRVPFASLDALMDLLAEMVIFRNRLHDAIGQGHAAALESGDALLDRWEEVDRAHEALGKTLNVVQDRVMRLRLVPLRTLLGQLRRIVHDEGRREGKQVQLVTEGGETPMDKALLEVASEALGHLVRNAVIHGIESPAVRRERGKPAVGTLRLSAVIAGNEVRIDVANDGGGVRRDALLRAATDRGIAVPADADLRTLLFLQGVSTRESADLSAGRGVGMAAVGEAVSRMSGRIEVATREGAGTRFRLRLPVSVSITRALLLRADNEEYALPLTAVVESLRLRREDLHEINGAEVVRWRRGLLPVVDLGCSFGTRERPREAGYLVVIEADDRRRGLLVDDLAGIREIVVKGLDLLAGNPPGVSGSTILGDGRAILILDPSGLANVSPFVREGREVVS